METTQHIPADVRERVLTVLTGIEWAAEADHPEGGWYACCPWCEGGDPDDDETPPGRAGHAELCELAAVLALLRTPRGEGEIAAVLDAVEAEADKWDEGIVPSLASRETVREIRRRLAVLLTEAQGEAETLAAEILAELRRAREKFSGDNVTALAMVEEVGELAKALIDESRDRVREEAVQVAAMAMRVVLDGDQTLDAWRESKGLDPLTAARRGEGGG